ncbi:hypothetical protein F5B20DRAFT_558206 [Whalleya microplaca]|nr:hypothetical protein F5B20DRAFT_558206 [Whalleya microplaca]
MLSTNSPPPELHERQRWTPEQDRILDAAVAEVSRPGQTISWHKVAGYLPGRSNKDCRKRWHYKIAHCFKQGVWMPEEDDKLRRAVQMHGTRWTKVSEAVGSRNGDQCWKRWHDKLDPRIDHSPWSPDEDAVLLQRVERIGRNWREIINTHFPNRTALSAKNRFALLQRRMENGECGYTSSHQRLSSTASLTPSTVASDFSSTPYLGWHSPQTPNSDSISDIGHDTQSRTVDNLFAFNSSENHVANSKSLPQSEPSPVAGCATVSELTQPFSDLTTQLDVAHTEGTQPGCSLNGSLRDSNPFPDKILHIKASCDARRLEGIMCRISKGINEMMIAGEIQHVQCYVE